MSGSLKVGSNPAVAAASDPSELKSLATSLHRFADGVRSGSMKLDGARTASWLYSQYQPGPEGRVNLQRVANNITITLNALKEREATLRSQGSTSGARQAASELVDLKLAYDDLVKAIEAKGMSMPTPTPQYIDDGFDP